MPISSGPHKPISHQVPQISDTVQSELREIDSTGTLKSGEKVLAELRKRKLIIPRYALNGRLDLSVFIKSFTQKCSMVRYIQGPQLQHFYR
jgi:hypothetical protein